MFIWDSCIQIQSEVVWYLSLQLFDKFEYEANAMTGNHIKLAWENSWNQVILFLAGLGYLKPLCGAALRRNLRGCFVAGGRP